MSNSINELFGDLVEDVQLEEISAQDIEQGNIVTESSPSTESTQETVNESQTAEEAETQRQKMVSYGALKEEREWRKMLQRQQEEMKKEVERLANFEKKWQIALEKANQQTQPKPPAYDEDPLEHLKFQNTELQNKLQALEGHYGEQIQERQQANYRYELSMRAQSQVNEFLSENPDYVDAYQHLRNLRYQQYVISGYTPEQAQQTVLEDEFYLAEQAISQGDNVARRVYEMAKISGYRPRQSQATPTSTNVTPFEQKAKQGSSEKLAQLERGMEASKSLSSTSGKSETALTLESLVSMSDDEFAENAHLWDKLVRQMR